MVSLTNALLQPILNEKNHFPWYLLEMSRFVGNRLDLSRNVHFRAVLVLSKVFAYDWLQDRNLKVKSCIAVLFGFVLVQNAIEEPNFMQSCAFLWATTNWAFSLA